MPGANIVVIGYALPDYCDLKDRWITFSSRAGVQGLTNALIMSRDHGNSVSVISKHMPGDVDIEYASPMAGAIYLP